MKGVSEVLGALTGLGVTALIFMAVPEKPFLEVNALDVVGDEVIVERRINAPKTIADWRVTIVRHDKQEPACQTIPGPKLHEGWSVYEESENNVKVMSLDVWVGDTGCYDRLTPGTYDMFITWTPRDGRNPVPQTVTFDVI